MEPDFPWQQHSLKMLKRSPLFKNIDDGTLLNMLQSFTPQTWMKRSPAMNPRQTLEQFYIIISGRLKVSQIHPETAREQTFFILKPGDVFDLVCLLDNREHDVITTCLDHLETLCAPVQVVRAWIDKHPAFNRTFLPYLAQRMRKLEELATDLSLYDTWTRLAKLLLHSVDKKHPHKKLRLINDLSHEEIANLIGSARAVVNRHIQHLKEEGILTARRGDLAIQDLHLLLEKVEKRLGFHRN